MWFENETTTVYPTGAILSSPQEIPHNKCPRGEENVNLSPYDTFGAKVVSGPVALKPFSDFLLH